MANLERIYTIPLGDAYLRVRNKRAKRAIAFVQAFAMRHMKAASVKISEGVNSLVFRDGMQKPPRRIKVRIVKGDDSVARVWLIGEEEKVKAAADRKKAEEEAAKKASEEKRKREAEAKKAAAEKKDAAKPGAAAAPKTTAPQTAKVSAPSAQARQPTAVPSQAAQKQPAPSRQSSPPAPAPAAHPETPQKK